MKKILIAALLIASAITLSGCKKEIEIEEITNYDHLTELAYYDYLNVENPDITIDVKGYGAITIQLFPEIAPNTVNNFIQYIEDGAFSNNEFHRVVSGFMIQGGKLVDPECEIKGDFGANGIVNPLLHSRGVISMARVGGLMDSQTSQFFIMHQVAASLDNQYASFGGVIAGMDVVDAIAAMQEAGTEAPSETITITNITVNLKGNDKVERVCAADYVAPLPEINVPEEGTIVLSELDYFDLLSTTNPRVTITVEHVGSMVFELFPSEAPNTVNNFISIIEAGAFDDSEFHKAIRNVLLQGGYYADATCTIAGEMIDNGVTNNVAMTRGVIGMSREADDFDSADTQFFVLAANYTAIEGAYAGFGGLVSGFNVLDYLTNLQVTGSTLPSFDLAFESVTVALNGYVPAAPICITD